MLYWTSLKRLDRYNIIIVPAVANHRELKVIPMCFTKKLFNGFDYTVYR